MSSGKKYLIINADDFGLSEGVNRGIIHAYRKGVLTSTTLLAHMSASEHAIKLARANPSLGVGVHLNSTMGTDAYCQMPFQRPFSLGRNSTFAVPLLWIATATNRRVRSTLMDLFRHQLVWCLERGIEVTHLDTHKHLHIWPWITQVVGDIAREFNIPAVRLPYESPFSPGALELPLRTFLFLFLLFAKIGKKILRRRGIMTPDHFFGICNTGRWYKERFIDCIEALPTGVSEIMVHPAYLEGLSRRYTRLLDSRKKELEILTDRDVLSYFQESEVIRISYRFFGPGKI